MNDAPPEWRSKKYLRMLPIELLKVLSQDFISFGEYKEAFSLWVLSSPSFKMDPNFTKKHHSAMTYIFKTLVHPATLALAPEILKEKVKAELIARQSRSSSVVPEPPESL